MVGAASVASKLGKVFSISVFLILFSIILSNAAFESIEQKSFEPIIKDLGKRFVGVTQDLGDQSLKVIERRGVFDASLPLHSIAWEIFLVYGIFLASLASLFVWIKLFAIIIEKSPLSDSTSDFKNYGFAIIFFFAFQVVYLLATTENPNKFEVIAAPFISFVHLWNALPYFISPIAEQIQNVEDSPVANTTIAKLV